MAASFFSVSKTKKSVASAVAQVASSSQYTLPTTDDTVISAFYAQLTDKERIAHSIAVDKLGTSYDVTRTHGFQKWKKSQGSY